jgi:hypothetical protein
MLVMTPVSSEVVDSEKTRPIRLRQFDDACGDGKGTNVIQ